MLKKFECKIPLSLRESFETLIKCGNEISRWKLLNSDIEAGFLEWKQSFWSMLGLSKIKVELEEIGQKRTLATISIYRPAQLWDPGRMCERVFDRLDKRIWNNFSKAR